MWFSLSTDGWTWQFPAEIHKSDTESVMRSWAPVEVLMGWSLSFLSACVSWSMCFGFEPVIITWNLAFADHWTVRWKKQQKGNKSSFCPFRPTPLRFSRNNVVVGSINGDCQWLRLSWKKTHYSESIYQTHSVSNVKSLVKSPHWHLILLYKPQMFRRWTRQGNVGRFEHDKY